ncbi:MAG TPA: hypothetical protein VMW72_04065 [Sedimentisphaerales bacterium]|nr:hypothetical protein [Sedimentisphaerales bacterium]
MGTEAEDRDRQKKEDTASPASVQMFNGADDVTGLISERIENLVQAIDEIDTALIQRKGLNEKFLEQIKEERQEIKHHLNFLNEPWKTGFYPELEFLRLSFHKSLTSRAKDSRSEELKYWQDVIKLVMDRRKLVDEYKELLAAKKRLE